MGRDKDDNANNHYHSQRSDSRSARHSSNSPKSQDSDNRSRSPRRRDQQDHYESRHESDGPRQRRSSPHDHGRDYQDDRGSSSRYDERRQRSDNRYYRRDYYDPPTSEHLARFEDVAQDAAFFSSRWDDEDEEYAAPVRSSRYSADYREGKGPFRAATRFLDRVQTTFTQRNAAIKKPQKSTLWSKLKNNKRLSLVLALLIIFGCIAPSLTVAVTAYQQYTQLKTLGTSGLHELLAVKDLVSLTTKTADPASGIEGKGRAVLQPAVLAQIKMHSDNALTDFQQLNTIIAGRQGVLGLAGITPYASKVDSLGHVARLGVDLATILQQFALSGNDFTALFQGKLLDPTGGPLFTPTTFTQFMQLLSAVQVNIDDAARQIAGVNLADLPISHTQAAQFQQISSILPGIVQGIDTVVNNRDALRWLLGIDAPRLLLIQTMDRGELRPTGGFTGQFGTIAITGGRVGKISLSDVNVLDQSSANPFNIPAFNAPSPYKSWWPFAGFGLRDANLSADFPTSAKLSMYYFTHEGGPKIDGVITFSPLLIEHLLEPNVLGPLTLPCYNDTVTADNLEDKLHYYQLGPGIAKQAACAQSADTTLRKQFTAALSEQLQTRLRTAQPDQQGKAIASIMNDVKNKEVEIYFSDPNAEAFLAKTGADYALIRDPKVDTTMVVQSNIGGNKGSTFVTTTLQENITLAANGDAQHDLTISLAYKPTGDVYGFQVTPTSPQVITYRDYIRVYAPGSAKFVGGTGFDQNHSAPLCEGSCVPKGAPVCTKTPTNPTGVFTPGYSPYSSPNEGSGNSTINQIGGPTNTTSDEPGLSMFGGLVVLPGFCTATIVLQWIVPHPSGATGQPYTFIEQSQSDAFADTTIHIQHSQGSSQSSVTKHVVPQYANIKVTLP